MGTSDDTTETIRPPEMDEAEKLAQAPPTPPPPKRPSNFSEIFGTDRPASPLAGAPDAEVEGALGSLDEAIAAQSAEPEATVGEAEVAVDDLIAFEDDGEPDSTEQTSNSKEQDPPSDPDIVGFKDGPAFTADQGNGMFPDITDVTPETSGHISVDKSVDDLEREAIKADLVQAGVKIPDNIPMRMTDWRNMHAVFCKRVWPQDDGELRRVLITFLAAFNPGLKNARKRDNRTLAMATVSAIRKLGNAECAKALADQIELVQARSTPPPLPTPSAVPRPDPPPPYRKKT